MRWPRFLRQPRDPGGDADHARDRARMVAEQLEARGIRDPELLTAFGAVERHLFVDGDEPYGDHALPVGSGQTISQPFVVAMMTAAARPEGGWEGAAVLEIGTGSGYQAAILAALGARLVTIERHATLADEARGRLAQAGYADRVTVVVGDGTSGLATRAPYRSILVTAGGPSVPTPLMEQLEPSGGRLVMPVGDRQHQILTLVVRDGDEWTHEALEPVVFVPLIGEHGYPEEA
ncbi:MAG: protein-L-isoaspartate(D-aspartate) O-methyltransferase [Chloroflexi bacterium]|nr:protein-L-isoaspartate(D-aspartate) O-methyltransferase [Chloroflexota bacterium]